MFKYIFDFITELLGLPIEWYYEWFILFVIGEIAYLVAFDKVGSLYHGGFISGKAEGSFFHWTIRAFYFVVMWAITYGMIWIGKFATLYKIQTIIVIGSIIVTATVVKTIVWIKRRNKLVRVPVRNKEDEYRKFMKEKD